MIDWLYRWASSKLGPRERKFRWLLITLFKVILIPLSLFMLVAAGGLAYTLYAFFAPDTSRGNALFLIEAETNRLSFEVTSASRPMLFFVEGVTIVAEDRLVVDPTKGADDETRICVEGWVEVGPGAKVDLMVIDGRQAARIDGVEILLSNGGRGFVLEGVETPPNPLMITAPRDQSDATPLVTEALSMSGTLQIRDDPNCAVSRPSGREIAFAPRNEPIFIEGPGQIGQQTRVVPTRGCLEDAENCDEGTFLRVMEPTRAYITGQIDILARENLCLEQLIGRECNGLFRLDADSVPLPTGASVQGMVNDNFEAPTPLFGQVYFDGDFYILDVWSNANWIALTFPAYPSTAFSERSDQASERASASPNSVGELSYNELRLSLLDQLMTDAWILVAATALLTLFSWVLSVLQIELDMVPEELDNKLAKRMTEAQDPVSQDALTDTDRPDQGG